MIEFYKSIRYPASARENSIQGIVKLFALVDVSGKVEDVSISQGLSPACDKEAMRAFIASTQKGYHPLIYNSVPINYLMEVPVGFWLE